MSAPSTSSSSSSSSTAASTPVTPDIKTPPAQSSWTIPFTDTRVADLKLAWQTADLKRQAQNIDKTPCIRTALLYGIGGGVGLGSIRWFGGQRLKPAWNWAIGGFLTITIFQWHTCRAARAKELEAMRLIQENFKHIKERKV